MSGDEKPKICLVTNELYPLAPGGIGRMLYNFSRHNEKMGFPADLHYLIPFELVSRPGARAQLEDAFAGYGTIHVAPRLAEVPQPFARLLHRAAQQPWTLEHLLETSCSYYIGLLEAERATQGPFDVIEFPDFGGWGLASAEAKRAGLAFQDTLLAARLHSSLGMIIKAERFNDASIWNGMLVDAERHLLSHADLVVGHIQSLIEANANHYRLSDRWQGRIHLEFPPIMLEGHEGIEASMEEGTGLETDFIFSSRLQWFKRPDIFVRAAILFLERHPEHQGKFRIVSYGWDTDYISWLRSLVPISLRDRIEFTLDATLEQRAELLARSVVVIPSDYESLCLFAFEASEMGRKVILNRSCAAFGENPRWQEQANCLMFDGSVEDLTRVMETAIDWQPDSGVDMAPDMPYWLNPDLMAAKPARQNKAPRPSISVVCMGSDSLSELDDQISKAVFLEATLELQGGRDELIFLLPRGRYDPDGPHATRIKKRDWRVEFSSGLEECPEMLRHRLAALERDCVLLWPAGFDLHPNFIRQGLQSMTRDPGLSIFGGHVEVADPVTGRVDTLRAYGGEMPSLALASGRIAPPVSLFRRSFLGRARVDPRATGFWFEDFVRRSALDAESILIPPIIAATMEGNRSLEPETTPKLSAGLIDGYGLAQGLTPRMISINPREVASGTGTGIRTLPDRVLVNAKRIAPLSRRPQFDPVQYYPDVKVLLVHPLEDAPVTVAEVRGPPERLLRLNATLDNGSMQNEGVEAAMARVPDDLATDDLLAMLERNDFQPAGFALSGWLQLRPGEEASLDLYLSGASTGNDRILLMSRLPRGAGETYAHLRFKELRAWPVRQAF